MITQGFLNGLFLEDIDGDTWRVHKPFGYVTKSRDKICVPVGFVTDLASIPWLFRRVLPKSGPYNKAAVIHDWLYRNHTFERSRCDDILLEAMAFEGVGYCKRYTIYWAVRAGGWLPWMNEKRRLK